MAVNKIFKVFSSGSWIEYKFQAFDSEKLGGVLPSGYALALHEHVIGSITGLQTALNNRFNTSGGALSGLVSISQNMIDGSVSPFTNPHLALKPTNAIDTTGFVGITFGTSTTDNYGWSYGAQRTSNGNGDMIWRNHDSNVLGVERMRLSDAGVLSLSGVNVVLNNDSRLSNARPASSIDTTILGASTPSGTTFLAGDRSWKSISFNVLTGKPTNLTGYGITDAMSTNHPANAITGTNIGNWNTAYGWGNHASAGYIKTHPTITMETNTTTTSSPGYAGTFTTIDSITKDSNGHVTAINTKTVTMPSAQTIPSIPSIMDTTEGNTGTATTQRTINALNLKSIILNHSPAGSRPASSIDTTVLGTSTPSASTFLAGDRTWKSISFGAITGTIATSKITNFNNEVLALSPAGARPASSISDTVLGTSTPSASTFLAGDRTWKSISFGAITGTAVAGQIPTLAISKIDGLQTELNGKLSTSGTAADSSKLNGQSASYYQTASNAWNKTNLTFSVSGTTLTITTI